MRQQFDAIDRAGGNAQFAAGAQCCQHGVHALAGADDGIDRTGLDALAAADALGFADMRQRARFVCATCGVRWQWRLTERSRQRGNNGAAAGRAAVGRGVASRHGLGIGHAAAVAALSALRLWQQRIETIDEGEIDRHEPGRYGQL